jgi:uncharacterized membrane-anchored protein YjiN (DUF445 family)
MSQQEMTKQNGRRSYIANYILIIAAVLLLLAYPFRDLFWGGFLTHLAGAALIGGLADWYAVTALFKKPLGISFKTGLIPRSKERIAETARHMIESEILTVPNMYNILKHHPVLDVVLDYFHSERGTKAAEQVFGQMLNTILYTVDMQAVARTASNLGRDTLEKVPIAPMLGESLKVSFAGVAGKDFLDFLLLTMESMTKSDSAKTYLAEIYRESLRQYERRNFLYALVVKAALASETFSPEHVAGILQQKFLEVLEETKQQDSMYRRKVMKYLWELAERLENSKDWQERVEGYKMMLFDYTLSRPDLSESWLRYVQNPARQYRMCHVAASFAIERLEKWRQSETKVEKMNRYVLAMAAKELKRLQTWFGTTAEQQILQYDGDVLAAQLQDKVWYDLQMIRVNGSLVGALLGACIFLAMCGVKGGW